MPEAEIERRAAEGLTAPAASRGLRQMWTGLNVWGRDLIDDEHRDVGIEVLHRMISYIRAEALRLHVMDVALLLEHAEDAVIAFAPAPQGRQDRGPAGIGEVGRVEH